MERVKKILIADNEEDIRISLTMIFKRMGYIVSVAHDGDEALKILFDSQTGGQPFDLLICDLQMPILTGLDLVKRMIKKKNRTKVLVIAGVGDKEGVTQLRRLGCEDFINKPFLPRNIIERVSRLMKDVK